MHKASAVPLLQEPQGGVEGCPRAGRGKSSVDLVTMIMCLLYCLMPFLTKRCSVLAQQIMPVAQTVPWLTVSIPGEMLPVISTLSFSPCDTVTMKHISLGFERAKYSGR